MSTIIDADSNDCVISPRQPALNGAQEPRRSASNKRHTPVAFHLDTSEAIGHMASELSRDLKLILGQHTHPHGLARLELS